MKKLISSICLFLATLTAFAFSGCSLFSASEKEFSKAGMTITLTDRFVEKELVSFTAYYESANALVMVLKEEFTLVGTSSLTTSEYAQAVIQNNNVSATVQANDKYAYFDYQNSANGKDFYYYATCHKGTDAYWLIQFACVLGQEESFKANFDKWANSIVFE